MEIARFNDNFEERYEKEIRKIVVWGAGQGLKDRWEDISHIDIICDLNAKQIGEINGVQVVSLDEIAKLQEKVYVIVSVRSKQIFYDICGIIQDYGLDAVVFHLFDNITWGYSYGRMEKSYLSVNSCSNLRVNIVNKEETWIFKKFADKMAQQLTEMGIEVSTSSDTRDDVDINHHIPYVTYQPYCNDTLMITHVDNIKKLELLKKQLKIAGMGICMSKDTMNKLVSYGIPRNKLCYINPAHDNNRDIHKYTIGITHRCYDEWDLRKRATALLDILDGVNPKYFRFAIMGAGWDAIVEKMREMEFEVEYYSDFIYSKYNDLMKQMDYFLYTGFDEGAMGYLDALAAGVGTIVTPQGYHLDVDCPIDYPCSTVKQFRDAFLDLQIRRENKLKAVSEWTWKNYTLKHLEIWNYLLKRTNLKEIYSKQLCYQDGIYSAYIEDNRI